MYRTRKVLILATVACFGMIASGCGGASQDPYESGYVGSSRLSAVDQSRGAEDGPRIGSGFMSPVLNGSQVADSIGGDYATVPGAGSLGQTAVAYRNRGLTGFEGDLSTSLDGGLGLGDGAFSSNPYGDPLTDTSLAGCGGIDAADATFDSRYDDIGLDDPFLDDPMFDDLAMGDPFLDDPTVDAALADLDTAAMDNPLPDILGGEGFAC